MEALTVRAIESIGLEADIDLENASIAYIRELLTPYAEAIDQATSIESVRNWIDQVYPAPLAEEAQTWVDGTETVQDAAEVAISFLVSELADVAGDFAIGYTLPWDIKAGIQKDRAGLAQLLTVSNDDTLPVTIRLGGRDHAHNLSLDFVAGLQDYYYYAGGNIEVLVAGTFLDPYYLRDGDYTSRYDWRQGDKLGVGRHYLVTYVKPGDIPEDGDVRFFTSLDYIRGATTAALWRGEDVHTRVTNLRYIDEAGSHHLTF
jgi:hypothetical protein